VLIRRQAVEIEQHLPGGRGLRVVTDAGAAPQAFVVLRVLPEVEDPLVVEIRVGDTIGRVHDLEDGLVVRLVIGVRPQDGGRARILRLHPFHGFLAVNVLEPQVGIGPLLRRVTPARRTNRFRGHRTAHHTE